MQITLNGKNQEIEKGTNLQSLVEKLPFNADLVIAELNGSIIKKDQWGKQEIKQGDTLELLQFVGGG